MHLLAKLAHVMSFYPLVRTLTITFGERDIYENKTGVAPRAMNTGGGCRLVRTRSTPRILHTHLDG